MNRLHILGLISILHACPYPGSLGKRGLRHSLEGVKSPTFVYQECAGRANSTKTSWNPKRWLELPKTIRRMKTRQLGLHGHYWLDCFRSGRATGNQRQTDLDQQAALGPVVSSNGASVEAHGPFGDG